MASPACYLLLTLKLVCFGSFAQQIKGHPSKYYPTSSPSLKKENRQLHSIRVDEDGALAQGYEFTELLIQNSITLETTGGHASFLNGKVECPNRTIADMVRALYFNAGHSPDKWCYAA